MLMIDATVANILWVVVTGVVGVLLLAVAVEGYLRRPLNVFWRVLAAVGALTLIFPGLISDAIGALITAGLFMLAGQARPATRVNEA